MTTEIEVVIEADGTSKIEVTGMVGQGCSLHVNALTKALGGEVVQDEKKPEFFQAEKDNNKLKQGW